MASGGIRVQEGTVPATPPSGYVTIWMDTATSPAVCKVVKDTGAQVSLEAAAGSPEGTDVLSTGEVGGNKYLREDGDGTCSWQTVTATETNTLTTMTGVVDDQLPVGTGANTGAYKTLPATGAAAAVSYNSATNAFTQAASTDLSDTANIVLDNQANTYSTGAQDFSSATSLTVPTAAGAAPTASGQIAYDSTANQLEYGDATVNRIVVNTNEAQTLTTKTIDLASNTVTGTKAEFDTAVSDGNIAYTGGAHHDGFSDFVANEHIDHSGVTITVAGDANEITVAEGAQDISASRTFTVGIADAPTIPGTYMTLPTKADSDPTGADGRVYYNTTSNTLKYAEDTVWKTVANIDDAQTFSGANTFSGDTTFSGDVVLPLNVTTATNGEITVDATSDQLVYRSSAAEHVPLTTGTFGFNLQPAETGDQATGFYAVKAVTITGIRCHVTGSGTSVLWRLAHGTDPSVAGSEIETGTCSSKTSITSDTAMSGGAAVAAGDLVWLEATTVTGTIDEFFLQVEYTEDRV